MIRTAKAVMKPWVHFITEHVFFFHANIYGPLI